MVGFFLLAQVAYIAAFWPFRGRSVLHVHRVRLLGYLAVVVALVAVCAAGAAEMLVPVLVYGACLGTMAVLSTGVNRLTAVGGALFLVLRRADRPRRLRRRASACRCRGSG